MKRYILVCILFATAVCNLFAQSLNSANELYTNGDYEGAVEQYESILNSGLESSDLYYNLANAYYRLNKLAPAILNYERALRLNPDNADARHNLEFANLRTVDKISDGGKIFYEKWWASCRDLASANTWAILSVSFFIIMLVALALYLFTRPMWMRKTGFSIAVVALFAYVFVTIFAYQQKNISLSTDEAIIFVQTVTLKSTPDNSGTDLFILHEGTKVGVKQKLGLWSEVYTSDGNSGWLRTSSIEII